LSADYADYIEKENALQLGPNIYVNRHHLRVNNFAHLFWLEDTFLPEFCRHTFE
jgi:hypothetical protein